MLRLEGFSYRYAGATAAALHELDLELADGEVIGVVGGNEAGKTTLCLVLSGLAPRVIGGATRGRLLIDGADAAEWPMHALTGRVGIVFDDPSTQLSGVAMTVYEEVAFGPANQGLPRADLLARTEAALATLRIEGLADRDPARLSGGQQQLVAIASILAMRPAHVVLDEPTAQLDPAGTALVGDAIARLAEEGTSILLVEHKTDLVVRVARRVVVLEAGRIAAEGDAAEILADPRMLDWGVPAPAATRIRRRLGAAGLAASEIPDEVLAR